MICSYFLNISDLSLLGNIKSSSISLALHLIKGHPHLCPPLLSSLCYFPLPLEILIEADNFTGNKKGLKLITELCVYAIVEIAKTNNQ